MKFNRFINGGTAKATMIEKAIRKKRLTRVGFILNTFLFSLGGYVFFT